MPELPEAETIVRGLRPVIVGRTVHRTRVVKGDVLREAKASFARKVRERRIESVGRLCLRETRVPFRQP